MRKQVQINWRLLFLTVIALLAGLALYHGVWRDVRPEIKVFRIIFLSIVIEALPFMLLGVFVSSVLHNFVSEEWIKRVFPRGRYAGILLACLMGLVFPVCECGIVPVARRLVLKGVPLHCAVTFMLAAPVINPVVALSTLVAFNFNPQVLWFRMGLAFAVAFLIGVLISYLVRGGQLNPYGAHAHNHHCGCGCDHGHSATPAGKIADTIRIACDEFFEMGKYLILGAFLAASFQVFAGLNQIVDLGREPLLSIAGMMFFAFAVSVCSTADAFIAASFAGSFTFGSLVAFLVYGPMIDLKNVMMMLGSFKPRFVAFLVVAVTLIVAVVTCVLNLI